ncbi:hypothetical protein LCM17_23150 [Cereibacter sphaeroides]|nr:hypothetical protein [Cereibacter sphaeroides]
MIVTERTQAEIRKLARQGRLVDASFRAFQQLVYPGVPHDQVAALRVAFMAGAAEVHAILMNILDDGDEPTDADMSLYGGIASEIETFHNRTLVTMRAGREGKTDA